MSEPKSEEQQLDPRVVALKERRPKVVVHDMNDAQPVDEVRCYFCQDGKRVGRYECPFCGEWLTPPELAQSEDGEQ